MPSAGRMKIDLKRANHMIGYGALLPEEIKRYRNIRQFTTNDEIKLREYVTTNIQCGQRTALLVGKGDQYEGGVGIIDDHYERLAVGERTLFGTAEKVGRNILRNILQLDGIPWMTDYDMPLRGVPAFIVYSGPSLDRNIHLLKECQQRGVVFASNTPTDACIAAGVMPDVVCCLESRDVSNTLGSANPDYFVCDMTGHENNWQTRAKNKIRMYQPDLAYLKYALDSGTIPMGNGGFVGSTAIMLAYLWGAEPIVLLGFDLALTDDRCCASNMRYSNVTCNFDEDRTFVTYGGENNTHGRSYLTQVNGWRNQPIDTTYERVGYIDWCERFAQLAEGVELINATEGGAYLDGWKHHTLRETLCTAGWHTVLHNHRSLLDEQTRNLPTREDGGGRRVVDRIAQSLREIASLEGDYSAEATIRIRRLSREEPILFTLLAPRLVTLRYSQPNEDQRIRGVSDITTSCAKVMLEFTETLGC